MKTIKISQLQESTSFEGLYTIGTDVNDKSVKVSLDYINTYATEAMASAEQAVKDAQQAAEQAKESATAAEETTSTVEGQIEQTQELINEAQDTTSHHDRE